MHKYPCIDMRPDITKVSPQVDNLQSEIYNIIIIEVYWNKMSNQKTFCVFNFTRPNMISQNKMSEKRLPGQQTVSVNWKTQS